MLAIARAGAAAGCTEALFTLGDKPELRYKVAREELAALGCETTLEYLGRVAKLVLEETGLLPHLNPGVMSREDLAALRPVSASMGIMLETTRRAAVARRAARTGPRRTSCRRAGWRRSSLAGELRIPFTSGILIGIGETRAERVEALEALRGAARAPRPPAGGDRPELPRQAGHADGRARRAEPRRAPLDDRGRAAAAARRTSPCRRRRTSPTTTSRACSMPASTTGAASRPVTIDHVNPEAPWPDRDRLAAATRARGLELAPRLPVYPRYLSGEWVDPAVLPTALRASDALGPRARGRLAPGRGRRGARSWFARDALPVDTARRAGRGRARAPLPRPRRRARARLRRRRPAPPRGLRRRGQLRRHAEHPVHERLLLPLRLLRLLEGQAGGEPSRRAVPRPARGDRPPRARGLGSRRDRGLPPGRHPPGVHRRLLRLRRRRDPDRAARAAHPRLLRARGLAGGGDARPPARGVPGAVALARSRLAPGDGGRDPRRRGAGRDLPRQGLDRAVALRARQPRTASACART